MKRHTQICLPEWWTEMLRQRFGIDVHDERTLRRIASSLQKLSAHLNDVHGRQDRHTRPYLSDPRLREAYLVYYATANMLKIHVPLHEIARSGAFDGLGTVQITDLGCGPGTGLLGCASWFNKRFPQIELKYLGVDAVAPALQILTGIGSALSEGRPGLEVTTMRTDLSRDRDAIAAADIVLMMNAINELPQGSVKLLSRLQRMLTDDGWLVIIEPALRATSRQLLELRDIAAIEGWTVYAPCMRQHDCPALLSEQDWCHHDATWERPSFIAELDRMLGLVKLSLKFSYIVLNRRGLTLGQTLDEAKPLRVVSELALEKGRSWCFVCGEEGRFRCRRNTRDRSDENAAMDQLARYDIVSIEGEERRGGEAQITNQTRVVHMDV